MDYPQILQITADWKTWSGCFAEKKFNMDEGDALRRVALLKRNLTWIYCDAVSC